MSGTIVLLFASLIFVSSAPKALDTKGYFQSSYDKVSNVRYQAHHDDKNVYLKINTTDNVSILKILRTGLTVYFDSNGKKKKKVSLQYPLPFESDEQSDFRRQMRNDERQQMELSKMLRKIPKEAVFSSHDVKEFIHFGVSKTNIMAELSSPDNEELNYEIIIPISRVSDEGFENTKKLSIGIESGAFEPPAGAMRGGGMPGGAKGAPPGGMNMSEMMTPIQIWFKIEILTQ